MNIHRFRLVLAHIEKHPEEWRQSTVDQCFIGIAAKLSGHPGSWFAAGVFLGFEWAREHKILGWISNGERTLDDFRTVARRTYA